MKMVVIGGTGLIGSKTVAILRQRSHDVVAGSPKRGVNTISGDGLKEAMAGTQVVIDLANSPAFEDKAVLEFFETSGWNLLTTEAAAAYAYSTIRQVASGFKKPGRCKVLRRARKDEGGYCTDTEDRSKPAA